MWMLPAQKYMNFAACLLARSLSSSFTIQVASILLGEATNLIEKMQPEEEEEEEEVS